MCTLKNPKEFTEKLTELISDFGLGTEYKVNEIHTHTHTHTHTQSTNNWKVKFLKYHLQQHQKRNENTGTNNEMCARRQLY